MINRNTPARSAQHAHSGYECSVRCCRARTPSTTATCRWCKSLARWSPLCVSPLNACGEHFVYVPYGMELANECVPHRTEAERHAHASSCVWAPPLIYHARYDDGYCLMPPRASYAHTQTYTHTQSHTTRASIVVTAIRSDPLL